MAEWNLYLVRCRDGSLYTGITTDVARRFAEHSKNNGAKYLRGKGPLELVLQKKVIGRNLAQSLERKIKNLPRQKKEELITSPVLLESLIRKMTQ